MSGSPVAVRSGASLLSRWLLPRVRQHSALSAASWRSVLRGAANTQQLRWQLQPLDLACGTLFRSSCAIQTSPMDCSGDDWETLFQEAWTRRSVTSAMRRLRKTLTYLITYLLEVACCLIPEWRPCDQTVDLHVNSISWALGDWRSVISCC